MNVLEDCIIFLVQVGCILINFYLKLKQKYSVWSFNENAKFISFHGRTLSGYSEIIKFIKQAKTCCCSIYVGTVHVSVINWCVITQQSILLFSLLAVNQLLFTLILFYFLGLSLHCYVITHQLMTLTFTVPTQISQQLG